jgi:uncharacterized protein (DUF58 family)
VDSRHRAASVSLDWAPASRQRRLVTLAALTLFLATLTRHGAVAVLAAPPVWLLVRPYLMGATHGLRPRSTSLEVTSHVSPGRCLEGEIATVTVRIDSAVALDDIDVELVTGGGVELADAEALICVIPAGRSTVVEWNVRATRWGRRDVGRVRIHAHFAGQLFSASGEAPLAALDVYPQAPPISLLRTPYWLPDRVGDHVSRVAGDGVEFVDVREYRVGDRPRRINWRATARRGTLQANRTAAERACDVVVLLDAFSDVGAPANSSLDVAVRGAVSISQAYLARHDRVGLVVLGGELAWLRPDVGGRQFVRVIERVLEARHAHAADRVAVSDAPKAALPPSALVFVLSPLLDPRALDAVRHLRSRGVTPVVIDVRTCEPVPEPGLPHSDLALRLWRVEHSLTLRGLRRSGVPIVAWDGREGLDVAISKLPRHVRPA